MFLWLIEISSCHTFISSHLGYWFIFHVLAKLPWDIFFQNAAVRLLTKSSTKGHRYSPLTTESTLRFRIWLSEPCMKENYCTTFKIYIHASPAEVMWPGPAGTRLRTGRLSFYSKLWNSETFSLWPWNLWTPWSLSKKAPKVFLHLLLGKFLFCVVKHFVVFIFKGAVNMSYLKHFGTRNLCSRRDFCFFIHWCV